MMDETEDLPVRPKDIIFLSQSKVDALNALAIGDSANIAFTKQSDTEYNQQFEVKGRTYQFIEFINRTNAEVRKIKLQNSPCSQNASSGSCRRSSRQSSGKSARELLGLSPRRPVTGSNKVQVFSLIAEIMGVTKPTSTPKKSQERDVNITPSRSTRSCSKKNPQVLQKDVAAHARSKRKELETHGASDKEINGENKCKKRREDDISDDTTPAISVEVVQNKVSDGTSVMNVTAEVTNGEGDVPVTDDNDSGSIEDNNINTEKNCDVKDMKEGSVKEIVSNNENHTDTNDSNAENTKEVKDGNNIVTAEMNSEHTSDSVDMGENDAAGMGSEMANVVQAVNDQCQPTQQETYPEKSQYTLVKTSDGKVLRLLNVSDMEQEPQEAVDTYDNDDVYTQDQTQYIPSTSKNVTDTTSVQYMSGTMGHTVIQAVSQDGATVQVLQEGAPVNDGVAYTTYNLDQMGYDPSTVKVESTDSYPREVVENIVVEYGAENHPEQPEIHYATDDPEIHYATDGPETHFTTDDQLTQHITVVQGQDSQFYQQDGTLITPATNNEVWEALNKLAVSGQNQNTSQQDVDFQSQEGSFVAEVVESEEVLQNLVEVVANSTNTMELTSKLEAGVTIKEKTVYTEKNIPAYLRKAIIADKLRENNGGKKVIPKAIQIVTSSIGYRKPITNADLLEEELTAKGKHKPTEQLLIMPEFEELVAKLKPDDNIDAHVVVSKRDFPVHDYRKSMHMKCKYCGIPIKSKHHFRRHIITHLEVEFKPWKCPLCDYRALIKPTIKKHINIHSAVKPYACIECGRGFNFKQKLQLHMKYHHDIRDFYCAFCSMAFHELKTLKNHLSHVHHVENPKEFLWSHRDYREPKSMHLEGDSTKHLQTGFRKRRKMFYNSKLSSGIDAKRQDGTKLELTLPNSLLESDNPKQSSLNQHQKVEQVIEIQEEAQNESQEEEDSLPEVMSEEEEEMMAEKQEVTSKQKAMIPDEQKMRSHSENATSTETQKVKSKHPREAKLLNVKDIKTEADVSIYNKSGCEKKESKLPNQKVVSISGIVVPPPKVIKLDSSFDFSKLKSSGGKFIPVKGQGQNFIPTLKGLTIKNPNVSPQVISSGKLVSTGQGNNDPSEKKPRIVYVKLPPNVKIMKKPFPVSAQVGGKGGIKLSGDKSSGNAGSLKEIKTEKCDPSDSEYGTATKLLKVTSKMPTATDKVCHVVIESDNTLAADNSGDEYSDGDDSEPLQRSDEEDNSDKSEKTDSEPKKTFTPVTKRSKIYGTHKIQANTRKFKVLEQQTLKDNNNAISYKPLSLSKLNKVSGVRGKKIYSIDQVDVGVRQYVLFLEHPVFNCQRTFSCRLCAELDDPDQAYSVGIYSKFLDHLSTVHPDLKPFKCIDCGFFCRSKANLISHRKKHGGVRKYVCNTCGKGFLFSQKLKVHMRTHSNRREHICSLCNHGFNEKCDLNRHFRKVHMKERNTQCKLCDKLFFGVADMKRHLETHNDGKSYECTYCKKNYQTKVSLGQHMKSHTCMFHCEICNRDFGSYSGFMAHKVMHDESSDGYKCPDCNKVLTTKGSMKRHMANCHTDERPYGCDSCDKAFKSKKDLQGHSVMHENLRVYVCEVCKFSSKRIDSLKVHMRRHAVVKPFQCGVCMKEYTQKNALEQHMIQHTGQSYVCEVCKGHFSSKNVLHQHMMKKHVPDSLKDQVRETGNITVYMCEECRSVFVSQDDLARHVRETGNITVYMCEECQSVFVSQDDLAGHILSEHMKQGLSSSYVDSDRRVNRPEEMAIGLGVPQPTDIECEVVTDSTQDLLNVNSASNITSSVRTLVQPIEQVFTSQNSQPMEADNTNVVNTAVEHDNVEIVQPSRNSDVQVEIVPSLEMTVEDG